MNTLTYLIQVSCDEGNYIINPKFDRLSDE